MNKWRKDEVFTPVAPVSPGWTPPPAPRYQDQVPDEVPAYTVERAMQQRMDRMRLEFIKVATARGWDASSVDEVLVVGGMAPMRDMWEVVTETVTRQGVRVLAMSERDAREQVDLDADTTIVSVQKMGEGE